MVPRILEVWTDLEDDFGRLAAFGAVLRQFSIASRQGLDVLVLWQFARGEEAKEQNGGP
jgi:hypothetical protein